ncbi:MAG TPA: hypothetical protein VL986_04540 [Terracidiphilus sp.]|nr:hypothetical protein [Terracidiphilus sp.]
MSDLEKKQEQHEDAEDDRQQGPNLTLLYSLIALALVAAMFLAGLIVLPFYRGRH